MNVRKNKGMKIGLSFVISWILLLTSVMTISASSVGDLQEQQQQILQQQEALQQAKEELEQALGNMNSQLYTIGEEIAELQQQQEDNRLAMEQTREQLQEAEEISARQYEDMKLRIQFMYENSLQLSWTTLLSSESFSDFLNRSRYLQEIATADKRLMEEYEQTLQTITQTREQLEQQQIALAENEKQLTDKQTELLTAIADKQTLIDQTASSLQQAENEAAQLASQIAAMEEYERRLEEQKAAEEAARQEAARQEAEKQNADNQNSTSGDSGTSNSNSNNSGTTNSNSGTTNTGTSNTNGETVTPQVGEEELLAAIIYCESGGESYESMLAVGSVVLNRVNHPHFPGTITGVIYQKNQFSPAASGRLATVLEKNMTSESCKNAAKEVLGGNITGNWLYFRLDNGQIDGTVIGKQVFY